MEFSLTLNREPWTGCLPEPGQTLLQFLRAQGLTGAKEGCAEGDCGACAVALRDRNAAGGAVWRSVNSCLVPAATLHGREVMTSEGIGSPEHPHPVQQSMIRHHGSQCGYCTPGFICSLFEGWHRDDLRTGTQLTEQLAGNLCRCTGYRAIHDAACEAWADKPGGSPPDPDLGLEQSLPETLSGPVLCRPDSLTELLRLKAARPELTLIAGATELGLEITKKFRTFTGFLSTDSVAELHVLRRHSDAWEIGAAVCLTNIEDAAGPDFPSLGKMLWLFGSRLIRNRATLGGNLATASPIGDSAPVLLALGATLTLAGQGGVRTVALEDFFTGYRATVLLPDEVIVSIRIPLPPPGPGRRVEQFYKASRRAGMDISAVAGAMVVQVDPQNVIRGARLAFGGVAATPVMAAKAAAFLTGKSWSAQVLEAAAAIAQEEFSPLSDVRGSSAYRRQLIGGMIRRLHSDPPWSPSAEPLAPAAPFQKIPPPHESAGLHVTGRARYTDDLPPFAGELTTWLVVSPHAHARILRRDASAARAMPGIHAVLMAGDVPGLNDVGAVRQDEILLADTEVHFHGHPVALVVGETEALCRAAAAAVVVEYEVLPAILTLAQAVSADSYHTEPIFFRRGDTATAMAGAPNRLSGVFEMGGQEHFYLETHAARAIPGDDSSLHLIASTQHPSEIQAVVSHVLHLPRHLITVTSPRMGGGFGGKETQGNTPAALAALAAVKTGRPVRLRLHRDLDMQITGHRHPFLSRFEAGFNDDGRLLALRSELVSNGGWALDLSTAITDRALLHHDSAYHIPHVELSGRVAKTHLSSNTAFRGFGGPQGMLVIEEILHRIARQCGLTPEMVRQRNLYHGSGDTNTTHYGQEIGDNRLNRIWEELGVSSSLPQRRKAIEAWNEGHPDRKRGIAMTPVKFGISFTVSHLNQAGALVLIYQDGTVQVNHGGTEMGQGLHTKIRSIACAELGLSPDRIRIMPTSTDKVPNTSATAASSGSDLNGAAVLGACRILKARLEPVAAALLDSSPEDSLTFSDNGIHARGRRIEFTDAVMRAYMDRIPLAAAGHYATPGLSWDRATGKGRPFHYFACGAAVSEVEIDCFSGGTRVLRVDILHDAGQSLNPGVDRGQIEGGFIQGMGWLTMEELLWDREGQLLTHSPDTYKIPAMGDCPPDFRVHFLTDAGQPGTVRGSKAVGEPPLMLAISVRHAILDALEACPGSRPESLASPATHESILRALSGFAGESG